MTHLGCNLCGILQNLNKICQTFLEVLCVHERVLCLYLGGRSGQTFINLLLSLHQGGIEVLQPSLVLSEVPDISTVSLELVFDIIILSSEGVSQLLQSFQEFLCIF